MFASCVTTFEEAMEALRVSTDSMTIAGLLAALYSDPEHPQAQNLNYVPCLAGLEAGLAVALETADLDAARAIWVEIARIRGDASEASEAAIFGSRAGLFRLH